MADESKTYMSVDALREFERMRTLLSDRGQWDDITSALVEGYAVAYGRFVFAERLIKDNGGIAKNQETGRLGKSFVLEIATEAAKMMRFFMAELKLVERSSSGSGSGRAASADQDDSTKRLPADWFRTVTPGEKGGTARRTRGKAH